MGGPDKFSNDEFRGFRPFPIQLSNKNLTPFFEKKTQVF